MGLKKLIHKMPQQKRVPIRKKVQKPVVKKTITTEVAIQFDEIQSMQELEASLKESTCTLPNALSKFIAQQTDNTGFEAKGTHHFISLCLSYALKQFSSQASGAISMEEIRALVEVIQELDPSQKWGLIEWSKTNLGKFIENIDLFVNPNKEKLLEFIAFLFIIRGVLSGSTELENPLILTAISIGSYMLQQIEVISTDIALLFLSILWETYLLCQENKQILPEAISFLTKLTTFIEENNVSISIPTEDHTLLSIITNTNTELKNYYLVKYSLHLLYNLSLNYSDAGCYESISKTVVKLGSSLINKKPVFGSLWSKYQEVAKKSLKQEERIKESLQLQLEKPKEIRTFEPIIDDEYLPFKSRDKELMSSKIEKRKQQNQKQAKRAEIRKIKKQSLLQEEIRAEQREHLLEKQNQIVKAERQQLEQDLLYLFYYKI
jgi:hypothetical protein